MIVYTLLGERLSAVAQTLSFIFGTVFSLARERVDIAEVWRWLPPVAVSSTTPVLTSFHLHVLNMTWCTSTHRSRQCRHHAGRSGLLCRPIWPVQWPGRCNESWPFCPVHCTGTSRCTPSQNSRNDLAYGAVVWMKTNLQASLSLCASLNDPCGQPEQL
jgi:hypothetical protein